MLYAISYIFFQTLNAHAKYNFKIKINPNPLSCFRLSATDDNIRFIAFLNNTN